MSEVNHRFSQTEDEGFLTFVRGLRTPVQYEAITHARPLTLISGYRRTENQWRDYEELPRWPERLVVLGDADCAFNPIYGHA